MPIAHLIKRKLNYIKIYCNPNHQKTPLNDLLVIVYLKIKKIIKIMSINLVNLNLQTLLKNNNTSYMYLI